MGTVLKQLLPWRVLGSAAMSAGQDFGKRFFAELGRASEGPGPRTCGNAAPAGQWVGKLAWWASLPSQSSRSPQQLSRGLLGRRPESSSIPRLSSLRSTSRSISAWRLREPGLGHRDSSLNVREVCLHTANKQGLSDHLPLQVAVYDKVLARVPSNARLRHTRRAVPALVSRQPRHHSPSQLPNTDVNTNSRHRRPPNQAACSLAQHYTLSPVSHTHTHLEGPLLCLHPAPSPPPWGAQNPTHPCGGHTSAAPHPEPHIIAPLQMP